MAAQVQINNVEASGQAIYVSGFIVLTGNYPTGGDPLNFTTATADPTFVGLLPAIESSGVLNVDVWSMGGSTINGSNSTNYDTICTKAGSPPIISPSTGVKLLVAALAASPSTQHSAAAYESQYLNDITAFMAVFTKNL
jgi:hypothetical protein